jgi:hypothetical protein
LDMRCEERVEHALHVKVISYEGTSGRGSVLGSSSGRSVNGLAVDSHRRCCDREVVGRCDWMRRRGGNADEGRDERCRSCWRHAWVTEGWRKQTRCRVRVTDGRDMAQELVIRQKQSESELSQPWLFAAASPGGEEFCQMDRARELVLSECGEQLPLPALLMLDITKSPSVFMFLRITCLCFSPLFTLLFVFSEGCCPEDFRTK